MKPDDGSLTGSGGKSITNKNESHYVVAHLNLRKSPRTVGLMCADLSVIPENVVWLESSDFMHEHVIRHYL